MEKAQKTVKNAIKTPKSANKTTKTVRKSTKNEKNEENSEVKIPKTTVKKTRLGRPPRIKTKDLIAAAYEYMDSAMVPSVTEFALLQGYERQYLYERASIEKNKGKPELSDTIKKISQCKEVKLEKMAITGLCPPNFAIFALKQLGWTDKVEVKDNTEDTESGLAYIAPRLEN